jgi:hypothetical protein
MSYNIGGEKFESKKDVRDRCRSIRDQYDIGEPVSDEHGDWITALLKVGEEVVEDWEPGWTDGIDHYIVDKADYGTTCFYAVREDGSRDKFGWNTVIEAL